jgi:hypothetical protein
MMVRASSHGLTPCRATALWVRQRFLADVQATPVPASLPGIPTRRASEGSAAEPSLARRDRPGKQLLLSRYRRDR